MPIVVLFLNEQVFNTKGTTAEMKVLLFLNFCWGVAKYVTHCHFMWSTISIIN